MSGMWLMAGFPDGSANAPAGIAQHATLLNSYAKRPPWRVAGVDYAVGPNVGTVFKIPNVDALPSGASLNTGNSSIILSSPGTVLDGWDCTANDTNGHPGWQVLVQAANCIVRNCKLFCNATTGGNPLTGNGSATGLYVGYCISDGNNVNGVGASNITLSAGGATIEYCWMKNAYGQQLAGGGVQPVGTQNTGFLVRYNIFEQANSAAGVGVHGDWYEGPSGIVNLENFRMLFNLCYQFANGTQGLMNEPGVGSATSGEHGWNTVVTVSPATVNFLFGADRSSFVSPGWAIHDNYVDLSGTVSGTSTDFSRPASAYPANTNGFNSSTYANNINMVTGASLPTSFP